MDWCLGMNLHSFPLSHFSILGAVRTWGYMGTLVLTDRLKQTVCFSNFFNDSVVRFWSCIFVLSKIIELGEWQDFVSLAPSQLPPFSGSPSPITRRVPSLPVGPNNTSPPSPSSDSLPKRHLSPP